MAIKLMRDAVLGALCAATLSAPAFAGVTPEWTAKVRQMLVAKQDYPRAAQVRGDEGTARLKLEVGADGAINSVALMQPSGSPALDKEALAVPRKIGSFPPPPGGATTLIVPLTWKML
jgi:protein TonB